MLPTSAIKLAETAVKTANQAEVRISMGVNSIRSIPTVIIYNNKILDFCLMVLLKLQAIHMTSLKGGIFLA